MRSRFGSWMACTVAVAGLARVAGAQEPPELPPGTRVVIVEEVPQSGREIRVGERETFRLASTDQMLVRVEVGQEGPPAALVTPRVGQAYTMRLQFVHDPEIGGKLVTADEIRQQVESDAAEYLDVATEGAVKCRPLKYGGRAGCYATLTDSRLVDVARPAPHQFKHVAVGVIRLSEESVLKFQILTNDLASRDFFGPMEYAMEFVKPLPTTREAK